MDTGASVPVYATAQADHKYISVCAQNFQKLLAHDRLADADQQFADIQQLIEVDVKEHFTHEETRVFPVLLKRNLGEAVTRLILELQQEHIPLLARAKQLNDLLHHRKLAYCSTELWMIIANFLTDFQKHANKEEFLFALFPADPAS
jgi:iron-sulfur cluster repair protein YtfE (RIC family)